MQRQFRLGGGVSPRGTLLRGQSIIEYVLIIAIIGLVIVFAGPGVAGAIRNQFNQVTNTVNSGTGGGSEGGAAGGGSTGADSATVQAAVAKDAKDWTLGEQKVVAEDIAAKGEASPAYAKAKAAMGAGTKFSVKLTDGKTLEYRIIGINHDDLADGSGKAGLTFEATNGVYGVQCVDQEMFDGDMWMNTELRQRLNSGDLWSLLPNELSGRIATVGKPDVTPHGKQVMADKMFLLSANEVYGNFDSCGSQYEYYAGKGVTRSNYSGASLGFDRWTRSEKPTNTSCLVYIRNDGGYAYSEASCNYYVCPAFSF